MPYIYQKNLPHAQVNRSRRTALGSIRQRGGDAGAAGARLSDLGRKSLGTMVRIGVALSPFMTA